MPSTRREERAQRREDARRELKAGTRQLGREGERPESPFGGLPISEVAILVGLIGAVIGFLQGGAPALVVGLSCAALGVIEITAREHFSGYRSHTVLLAAMPAVALEVGLVAVFGEPQQRILLLLVVVPVFAVLFWLLRRRFMAARQARVARPPRPAGLSRHAAAASRRLVELRPRRGCPALEPSPARPDRPAGAGSAVGGPGRCSVNTAPPSGALATVALPPCCSVTWRTIARPSPLPWRPRELVPRKKRSNT